ncbi:hypothetical protein ACFLZI_00875 [Nitrospirota bacterium]
MKSHGENQAVKKDPFGIQLVSLYMFALGAFSLYATIMANKHLSVSTIDILYSIMYIFGYFASFIGLIKLRGWGRHFTILLVSLGIAGGMTHLAVYAIESDNRELIKGLFPIIPGAAVLLYMLRKDIKQIFSRSPRSLALIAAILFLMFIKIKFADNNTNNVLADMCAMTYFAFAFYIANLARQEKQSSATDTRKLALQKSIPKFFRE